MAITTRVDLLKNFAAGKGYLCPHLIVGNGTVAAAGASVGHFAVTLHFNSIGSTLPGTLVSLPKATDTTTRMIGHFGAPIAAESAWLCYIYVIGTANMTATGDRFTHASATFPLLRKQFGQASQPINLIPVLYTTTAGSATAAQYILKTAAGGNGYVDQDGNGTVGTKTHVNPAATTNAQTLYILRLENGDASVRDISAIQVTTAATSLVVAVYGIELLCPIISPLAGVACITDLIYGGLGPSYLSPAVATSGTVTSYLGMIYSTTCGSNVNLGFISGAVP